MTHLIFFFFYQGKWVIHLGPIDAESTNGVG